MISKIERKRESSASSALHWVWMNSSGCISSRPLILFDRIPAVQDLQSAWLLLLFSRLVIVAAEVGGRSSEEAWSFVSQLARVTVSSLHRVLRGRARQAWEYRWSAILFCATAQAFALFLLDRRAVLGCDGDTHGLGRCCHLPPVA